MKFIEFETLELKQSASETNEAVVLIVSIVNKNQCILHVHCLTNKMLDTFVQDSLSYRFVTGHQKDYYKSISLWHFRERKKIWILTLRYVLRPVRRVTCILAAPGRRFLTGSLRDIIKGYFYYALKIPTSSVLPGRLHKPFLTA